MANKELLAELAQLHHDLAAVSELDGRTSAALKQLRDEISDLLDKDEPPGEEQVQAVQDRITALHQFEANHPQLTNFLTQLSNLLGNMGF